MVLTYLMWTALHRKLFDDERRLEKIALAVDVYARYDCADSEALAIH